MKIGFIGVGKIASCIVEALCTSAIEDTIINISPRNKENSLRLESKYFNVKRLASNQEVLNQSTVIFISLTPAVVTGVLTSLLFDSNHIVISLVPLLNYNDLTAMVFPASKISRTIPLPSVINHNCPIPIYYPYNEVVKIFEYIGQPIIVKSETELHALWTLTGLITPFYELLEELSGWTSNNGVNRQTANQYVANLFQSLTFMAQQAHPIDFSELAKHAATPGGMNEQAGKELRESNAHKLYTNASNNLLKRFK
jgi:pyrroline-5-carboxylate reductase